MQIALQARLRDPLRLRTISKDMKRMGSTMHSGDSRLTRMESHQPHGRDPEERERRRREWLRQQEREREHERFKRKKIEEWERKRRAEEKKSDKRRSSYRSRSRSAGRSSNSQRRVDPPASVTKPSVMSQKFESSSNNTRLFKGPESTIVDVAELRRIKVDIHRNIPAAGMSTELRREILNPEDVKLKRREGEGAKPIFEREELMKPEVSTSEVEEHRTVVALDNDREEKRPPHTTRKRSTSSTNSHKQNSRNSRRDSDARSSRRETSKHNDERSESHRDRKHDSEKVRSRDRSKEHRERPRRENSRERRSPRRPSHDVSRDNVDRHYRSSSRNRESRRNDTRRRSSRDRLPYRENGPRDDSRDRRSRDNRSRERMPHHYAETMPVPMYYEGFHPRPIMVGHMMPMRGQMPMGRGRMPSMMGPMRPPLPPRFIPPELFRPALNPNHRFGRMF